MFDETFLSNGLRWLNLKINLSSAVWCEYESKAGKKTLRAVIGTIDQSLEQEQDVELRTFRFDFIVYAKDVPGKPRAGDRIVCKNKTFEVVNLIAGRCFDYVDSTFEYYRIHAQLISEDD